MLRKNRATNAAAAVGRYLLIFSTAGHHTDGGFIAEISLVRSATRWLRDGRCGASSLCGRVQTAQ